MSTQIKTKTREKIHQTLDGGLPSLVGNTPLLPLRKISKHLPPHVHLQAKAEWFNPSGSVKDRPALNIILKALESGALSGGKHLLDSTSGNMGIAYATFGAALGIPVTLALPSNVSQERRQILQALGAELILTDPREGTDGALQKAQALSKQEPDRYFYANQYDNPANWQAHYQTTGPEILRQTRGGITHFIAGLGTSGTLMGVGRYLREKKPRVKIIGIQPDGPLHGVEGLKHMASAIRPGIYDPSLADRIIPVSTEDAQRMVRRLSAEEGYFVGLSAGAAAVAALKMGEEVEGGEIVTLFPDAGFKYLSDEDIWIQG
ncbi:MAG: cysteine synthase family protein [Anaerolineales bacterium]